MADVYGHPLYYDILFGWDRSVEAFFYDAAFQAHGLPSGSRLLEVGCGTGQVATRMARLEWSVTGLDNEPEMLAFCEDAAAADGVAIQTLQADMTDFTVDTPFAGAYCPMGTIGHLPDDDAVVNHLRATANALTPDGIYIIDTELVKGETTLWDYDDDEWSQTRGPLTVGIRDGMLYAENSETGNVDEVPWDAPLRCFNTDHIQTLIEQAGGFQIEACYPEADCTPQGISIFSIIHKELAPVPGRGMLVLKWND